MIVRPSLLVAGLAALVIGLGGLGGCGSTGSALVTFDAVAGGPADIVSPAAFETGLGYTVVLTEATLTIGAVYLDESVVTSGMQETSCILPTADVYDAEASGPLTLDLLSPELVPFPSGGNGTQTVARTGQVWLTSGAIDALTDPTVILSVEGGALRAAPAKTPGAIVPFSASVTISQNRALAVQNPALPGSNPICEERIVTPIAVELTPTQGGTLMLRVDPRRMFDAVDFVQLEVAGTSPPYVIPDTAEGPGNIGGALFSGLRARSGVYDFSFTP